METAVLNQCQMLDVHIQAVDEFVGISIYLFRAFHLIVGSAENPQGETVFVRFFYSICFSTRLAATVGFHSRLEICLDSHIYELKYSNNNW